MTRSIEEVRKSLKDSISNIDPSIDTEKGPVFDLLLGPMAPELVSIEETLDRVRQLASQQFENVATSEEIDALGTSFGLTRGEGKRASTNSQVFIAKSIPTTDINIQKGTLVGTYDNALIYQVTQDTILRANLRNSYYNAATRQYEIYAPVEAVAIGEDYNVGRYAVNKLLTPITFIDGTENRNEIRGGQDAESDELYYDRIRAKFLGSGYNSSNGLISLVKNYDPENIIDVNLVYPKDRSIFKRFTGRPALDVYISGSDMNIIEESITTTSSFTTYYPENQPVESVNNVSIDGELLESYALVKDTDPKTMNSIYAKDYIVLGTEVQFGDNLIVNYNHNALISNIQKDLFSEERPFDTSVWVREPIKKKVTVKLSLSVVSSYDPAKVSEEARNIVLDYCQSNKFIEKLSPLELRDRLESGISGLARQPSIINFCFTENNIMDIEFLKFEKNELSVVDLDTLEIQVGR